MDLASAVAIVTGSATGIGAATARLLASRGCKVVVNYSKSREDAEATAAACEAAGGEALVCRADVSNDGDCRQMAEEAMARWGRIDALVNNAGTTKFADHGDLEALHADDFQRIYAVNLVGPYQMVRAVAPHMKAAGHGAIVNVSSVAGVMGVGSSIAYCASKGALNTMTICLARALAPEIRVNTICPGFVESRWLRAGFGDERYEALKRWQEENVPLKAAGTPEKIAEAILPLIEGASHITGEILMVDGGWHTSLAPLKPR